MVLRLRGDGGSASSTEMRHTIKFVNIVTKKEFMVGVPNEKVPFGIYRAELCKKLGKSPAEMKKEVLLYFKG